MQNLFAPFEIENLTLDNRVVMAPMTRTMSPNNIPPKSVAEYYAKRAKGGTALIITEGTCIGHKAASGYPNVPFVDTPEQMQGWKDVVDAVHAEGGKIAPQLWHVGGIRRPGTEPGGDLPGYSPSGMALPGKITGHKMTIEDIKEVIAAYADAAQKSVKAGFDAIEIHGAHGYLIDQFFWEGTNRRTDAYGGSLEKRSRFAIEVIEAVKEAIGDAVPIIFRFSQWKQQNYEARLVDNPNDLERLVVPLSNAGVDIFHCSTRRFWEPEFEDSQLNLAGWTKKITGKPTITVGSVGLDQSFVADSAKGFSKGFSNGAVASLDNLYERLNNEEFDLVAVGRALIANPDWSNLIKSNRMEDILPFEKSMLATL